MADSLLNPDRIAVAPAKLIPPLAVGLQAAARLLGISDVHLAGFVKRGEIPHVRIGARIVFRLASLDAWLLDRECAVVEAKL